MILIYRRVSTADQAKEGTTSLSEQSRKCKAIAQLRGVSAFDIADYADADVSGSIPLSERPAGSRLLADAKAGDCIVATKLDRLFRSAEDALVTARRCKENGIDIILLDISSEPVTGVGIGKAMFNMMATFAELERERIAERMADGRQGKKQRGGHIGGQAPYGYRVVGAKRDARLEPDEHEQKLIDETWVLWKRNPPAVVTKHLNDAGYRDRAGHPFRIVQVKRIVRQAEKQYAVRAA
jgi:DNA invertase Pin-like site-specific DNA recombinase